jgi:hypothetical protein
MTALLETDLVPDAITFAEKPRHVVPHRFAEIAKLNCVGTPYKRTRLGDFIGSIIARAAVTPNYRGCINIAPRMGKSENGVFAGGVWFEEHFPQLRLILATHTASLALDFGRRIRNEFARNAYLTTQLQDDAKAADQWTTKQGGGLKAIGVGGAILGFGAHLILCDDLHRGWVEAQSATERRNVINWLEGTLMNRLEPGASIVLIGQRLNRDDVFGYLKKNGGPEWKFFALPAIARANDPMGREVGEAVCPERYSADELRAKIAATPRNIAAAIYDQAPEESNEGRTYSGYTDANLDPTVTLRLDQPVFATFDFNVNPGMHAEIGQSDTRADRIIFRHEIHGPRMKTPACAKAVADKLKEIGGGTFRFPKLIIYGDRSGRTENTQTTQDDYALIARTLRENGVQSIEFQVPSANPPVKARVSAMNDALTDGAGVHRVLVHPDCKRLVYDLENVEDDADGLPDKGDTDISHASDAAGYAVHKIRPVIKRQMVGGNVIRCGMR